jgi:hypothetical protein
VVGEQARRRVSLNVKYASILSVGVQKKQTNDKKKQAERKKVAGTATGLQACCTEPCLH